ncbi:hypothetical protein C8J57DRAFT_1084298 [Mycena rebaudengoi]|nr:hypothetical protein C8J57DRAFT_1084298 [Mycena rebaudengoi]
MEAIVIDDTPFIPEYWLGKGKAYSDAPFEVIAAKNAVFKLPPQVLRQIPDGNLPVMEFSELVLPRMSSELVYGESQLWFSDDEPTTDTALLTGRSIPPAKVLELLGRKSGQAWLNGAKSMADSRFNDGADRFPLWTLTFWKEMTDVIAEQKSWKRSIKWLENEGGKCKDGDTKVAIDAARAELKTMGWKAPLTYERGTTSTLDLREFLGTVWLKTTNINIMMEDLAERVASDPELADKAIVAQLAFADEVLGLKKGESTKRTSILHQYEREVKENGKEKIIFPANIGNKHWVAGVVDFIKKSIDFGFFKPPAKLIRSLQKWLHRQFGEVFQSEYDGLEHGIQTDGYSCGIVMHNTAERAAYPSTQLWIPRAAVLARVQHFLKYAKNRVKVPETKSETVRTISPSMSGSHMDIDAPEDVENEPEQTVVGAEEGVGLASDEAPLEVPVPDLPTVSEPGKKKQSTLFGFMKRVGNTLADRVESSTSKKRPRSDAGSVASVAVPTKKLKTKGKKKDTSESSAANVGASRSATLRRLEMDALKRGEFVVDQARYDNWKTSILKLDPLAEFDPENIRLARHSACATWLKGKKPYDASRFRAHVKGGCNIIHDGAGMSTMGSFLASDKSKSKPKTQKSKPVELKACPGITEHDIPNVQGYLRRSGASGGGSRSVFKIAMQKFEKAFSALGSKRQREVRDTQYHEHKWRNDHLNLRIFSTDCEKSVPGTTPRTLPCPSCTGLLSRKSFKKALKKPAPELKNFIYTNQEFRNQVLGEIYGRSIGLKDIIEQPNAKDTPCVRYAQGALQGKYDNKVFNGLVEAMVTKTDREERGVGMQNFKYAPAYDEFCNVLRVSSPATYRSFKEHLPARSERNFRAKEAREPRFPMDISDRNFKLAAEHLAALNYDGPVNLSCDDTKLFPSFRLYWDNDKKSHFLVGGTDGPMRVSDAEQVKSVIAESRARKATKIRLWCITIPVPGVTPIIVAALPIANDLKAPELLKYLIQVVDGLIDHNIKVVSYACDGTQIERTVQDLFVKQANEKIEHLIKDPHGKGPALRIVIAVVRGQSICMIQDSKHALKTFRNNLFSGARLLPLGSYTAIYARIREMAFADGSPLFHRDVEKLDRQDDNAATRLFSADTLKYLADHHPEYVGEIVYLFIFGGLIDAYQNRFICHAERVKLVLRARYFLDSWSSFLEISNYNKSLYCLSREALDIARIIIEGYLALARRIVKDFTMLDFLYMIPKLRIKIRAAVLRAKASDPKARAAGYTHTYFDNTGLDILALSTFPSDEDIDNAAAEAAEESDSLIALLGLAPSKLHAGSIPTLSILPSIDSWYEDVDESDGEDCTSDEESISEAQQLQGLLDKAEDEVAVGTHAKAEELLNLTSAALALSADDMMKIHTSNENEAEILDELAAEEQGSIRALIDAVPDLSTTEPTKPLGRGSATADTVDFDYLVELRRRHQTVQAARGVRTRVLDWSSDKAQEASLRQQLIKRLHLALKEDQDKAAGTGLERSVRWRAPAPAPPVAGNSANAVLSATALTKKVPTKRKDVFTKARVPCLPEVIGARVTILRPIRIGDYGIVLTAHGLMIGHVFAIYSKGGGKGGKHESVTDSSNISALSKISVQLFEKIHGTKFRSIPTATGVLQTKQFAHIPPVNFLCLLSAVPKLVPSGLALGADDSDRFKKFSPGLDKFNEAMVLFRKRGKKAAGTGDDSDDDIDGES